MACPKCNGRLAWQERSWTTAGEDPGHWRCIACGEVIYPEGIGLPNVPKQVEIGKEEDKEPVSYHLDSKKEEEIKKLLKTNSIREIVAKTGVAKNTIMRIRNENFTKEERAMMGKSNLIKGRNKREFEGEEPKKDLQNDGRNIPKIIPSADSGGKGGQEIMTEQTQTCTNPKCPKPNPQPIGEFNKNAARPSGHESRCRTCTAQAQRDRKAAIEKAASGRSGKAPGNGRRRGQPRSLRSARSHLPESAANKPYISEAVTLDSQLLRAVKKSAILDFVKNDLPKMVEEAFA